MQRSRIHLLSAVGLAVAGLAHAGPQPQHTASIDVLQRTVAERFPVRYPVGNLFDLDVQAPRLRLMPESNRLGAAMQIYAAGPALRRPHTGLFDLDFGLRYEARDQTLRARNPRVNVLRLDDMPPRNAELIETFGPALAQEALQDMVLHRLRPRDLALADAMGLEPGEIEVTPRGLVIHFVAKASR